MLVDDHPLWRDAIREILEEKGGDIVVAEASKGDEVVPVAKKSHPDVVVMDMGLPGLDGAGATRQLLEILPEIKVLVLSASDRESDVLEAVRAGARGYLLKTAARSEIVEAVGRVHRGELVLPAGLADVVLNQLREGKTASRERPRVVLADTSGLFREGLARALSEAGFEVTGDASNTDELLALMQT